MALNNRTYNLLSNIVTYLTTKVNAKITEYNGVHYESAPLPLIQESDVGYRDVATGLRFYPALLVMESSRDCSQPYFTTYVLNFCIANRNDDIDALQKEGSALLDCFEDALREDDTLGGNVLSTTDIRPDVGVVSGLYVGACGVTVTVDLGSFDGMGGEDGRG